MKVITTLMVALIALVVVFSASYIYNNPEANISSGIKQFESFDDLSDYIEQNRAYENYGSGGFAEGSSGVELRQSDTATAVHSAAGQAETKSSANDFSETNIQVAGVDEPDIVKNDGKYIYTVVDDKVVIVDAFPAENMNIASEIDLNKSIRNIFINGDKLIIFVQDYNYLPFSITGAEADTKIAAYPRPDYYQDKALIYVYDISDRENPELDKTISADGEFVDARMINDYVYVISSKYIDFGNIALPAFGVDGVERIVDVGRVSYFDSPDSNYVFTSIMAINLDDYEISNEVYLTGGTWNIFVSEENIYLTSTKRIEYKDYTERLVKEVILEVLPSREASKVEDILDSEDPSYKKLNDIQMILNDYSNSLKGQEKAEFDKELLEKLEDFQIVISKESEKTVIHKINIDGNDIEYVTVGEVPGNVLNQFSMDENDGYFRIATTTGETWRDTSLNHLYVLDKNLEIVGSVEDLARGERIFSTRFMGDRAYMVTFRQVDPLFVIDLSNPQNPEVLGYLKVTGFSNYLHPYDENHIIGIGREASTEGRSQGVKIALFDVSDVENPEEISKYEVKQQWSDTNALYDHKAFLFDKERKLLVLPMTYTEQTGEDYKYWQGAFVFNIDLDGIDLRGTVEHESNKTQDEYYYYGNYGDYIQRSLYMDNALYTISIAKIKASNLVDLNTIKSVDLPYDRPEVIYYAKGGVATATGVAFPE